MSKVGEIFKQIILEEKVSKNLDKKSSEHLKKRDDIALDLRKFLCKCDCGESRFFIHNTNPIADAMALEIYCTRCYKLQN